MATKTVLKKDELLEAIGNMSVFELAEFIEAFKDKFDVTVVAPAAAAPAANAGGDGADAGDEEQSSFTVVLKEVGSKKIQVIKVVREITSLGLKDAKDLVDKAPSDLKEDVEKAEADEIKRKLEEQGAVVELK